MGVIIYINGELEARGLIERTADKVRKIKDGWDDECFNLSNDLRIITFRCDTCEGCTPLDDGVEIPLKNLLELAKEEDIDVSGVISVSSDCGDYDNITITVDGGELKYENTEIVNATTEELIAELKKRINSNGEVMQTMFSDAKVEKCNKDVDGTPHLYRVHGLDGVTDFTADWWNRKWKGEN